MTRQRQLTYIIIAVLVLGILVYVALPKGTPSGGKAPIAEEIAEPQFKLEGNLYFFDQDTKDTLSALDIEVVDNPYDIERGLMYRKQMLDNRGMLFIFDDVKPRSFWMKNTYIPLDLIFVDQFNQIVSISRDAKPLDESSIPSGKPAKYVIEVNAGYATENEVSVGDFVLID